MHLISLYIIFLFYHILKKHVYIYNISSNKILNIKKIIENIQKTFEFCIIYERNKIIDEFDLEHSNIHNTTTFNSFSDLLLFNSKISNLKQENKLLKIYKSQPQDSDNIRKQTVSNYSDLYDGFILQNYYGQFLSPFELKLDDIHILIIDKLVCTFDLTDHRYHARTIVCGMPSLISTSGIVEGPAKPKEYYYKKIFYSQQPDELENIDDEFKNTCIQYDDERINSVIEGLICQSIFYNLMSANPFCKYDFCRLYNAHWQEELISIHIDQRRFCSEHEKILKNYQKNTSKLNTC